MIPIEIKEYKMRWMPNAYLVLLHSDLRSQGIEYCRTQMMQHQWDMRPYTDSYEDSFYFEWQQDANSFLSQFKNYARREL